MPDYGVATITLKTGPAIQNTAVVFSQVSKLEFGIGGRVLTFVSDGRIRTYELSGANTITITAVAGLYTISIT